MKKILLTTLLLVVGVVAWAQSRSGNYTTSDGNYTIEVKFENGKLILVEPNRTSEYTPIGGNKYQFVHTNGTTYYLESVNETTLASSTSRNSSKTYLTFSGESFEMPSQALNGEFEAIYNKYLGLMETDAGDAQTWAFCAAAALARAQFNGEGSEAYLTGVVLSMKQILPNVTSCPCEDAIPAAVWSATN